MSKDAPPSGVEVKKARRLWEPTLQAVRSVANVPHRKCQRARMQPGCPTKRYAIKPGLIACARGLNPVGDQKEDLSTAGPGQNKKRGTGFRIRSEGRKRAKLRKSRSGTETLHAVSARQTQGLETTVETLSVSTRTNTGLQYKKTKLENPPTLAS
ncbi:hypothetical protein PF008_g14397 [Phytophthora fragariae]|uniref:Uncharacterized protein n=1 Tax=Phytophthora fragariae TaxID=53985 RepID=A0A6G0RI04_9STRA|nr:hypothetical protein PF008_g14397 [Phytophthora fragariae]